MLKRGPFSLCYPLVLSASSALPNAARQRCKQWVGNIVSQQTAAMWSVVSANDTAMASALHHWRALTHSLFPLTCTVPFMDAVL